MSFLSPLFFVGLAAIAVPVLVHLIQRERKRVIEFPSLMFVRRIPYQSVRRRRIRHWFLLLMRAAAIALIVAAFTRPFFPQGAAAAAAASGDREVVLLIDQSASMGYGNHWQQARDRAIEAIRALGSNDKATIVLFGRNAEEQVRATGDRGRLEAAVNAATRDLWRDALRAGAEARREHSDAVDAAAPRSDSHLRLPASRLERRRGRPFRRGHDAQAGADRDRQDRESLGAVGDLCPRLVLRPGAHHRHGRGDEPERRRGRRRCRSRSRWKVTRSKNRR